MAALVKGLSGSATFRSPAGSWVMRCRISGGGRPYRMLGRRLNWKPRSCAVRDRTLEDWLDALRVKTAKAKSGIPCPLCGGDGSLPPAARNAGAGRDWRVPAMLEAAVP